MQKELTNQAMALFDTPEKWNAFLDLVSEKESIKYYWHSTLKKALSKRFKEDPMEKWVFDKNGMTWYLKEFGKDSLAIWLEDYTDYSLWVKPDYFDSDKVTELLKKKEYSSIPSLFTQPYVKYQEGNYKFREKMNYIFDIFDKQYINLNIEQLAWFAEHKTEDFVNQIAEKVDRFRKDKELTKLFQELNEQTKK